MSRILSLPHQVRRRAVAPESVALSRTWESAYPGLATEADILRSEFPDCWVRFHSLPESKRYADTPEEYEEIERRHLTVLDELRGSSSEEDLLVLVSTWSRRRAPRTYAPAGVTTPLAWHWRSDALEDNRRWSRHVWGLTFESLDLWSTEASSFRTLLKAVADEEVHNVIIAPPSLDWLYHPYDGGADVIAQTTERRDALRDTHSAWLSTYMFGL